MTEWSQYRHYWCKHCGEACINHVDGTPSEHRLCRFCVKIDPDIHLGDTDTFGADNEPVHAGGPR